MERKIFFDTLRGGMYRGGVPQSAVTAIELIVNKAALYDAPAEWVAYMLATARHEVGLDLIPKRESLNYHVNALVANFSRERISLADAQRLGRKAGEGPVPVARQMQIANLIYGGEWGKVNLGNMKPGSGWLYRGGGYPQTTGARNFNEVGKLVGVDLINHPERIIEPEIACTALVACMIKGTYTRKKLADYRFPEQFYNARAIINNDVAKNGAAIARYAEEFLHALKLAGYSPASVRLQASAESGRLVTDAKETKVYETEHAVLTEELPDGSGKGGGLIAGAVMAFLAALVGVATWTGSKVCEWSGYFCGG